MQAIRNFCKLSTFLKLKLDRNKTSIFVPDS